MKALLLWLRNRWLMGRRPHMIYPYKSSQGKVMKGTRVSNATYIDHEKSLKLGERVFIGHFNFLEASHGLTIGDGCQITNYVTITTHSSHQSIRLYGAQYAGSEMIGYVKGPISIGAYTFVGPHSTIMPGTTIGKGCIVSAYSLVNGNFPDFSIISGNPAIVVGDTREKDKIILEQHPELNPFYHEWAGS
jgi:acetyltransferase-like isoleucine patch superfamily enzyme